MRTSPLLLALSATVVVVAGAWYALQPPAEESAQVLALSQESPEAPGGPGGSTELAAASAPEIGAREEATAETSASPVSEGGVATGTAQAGRSIVGRVVDEFGNPVPDARVFVARSSGFTSAQIDRLPDDADGLVSVERSQTGEGGRFEIESKLRGELRFAVRAPSFAPLRVLRDVEGGDEAEIEDLVLVRGVTLSGYVVDQAGVGVSGVGLDPIVTERSGGLVMTFGAGPSRSLVTSGPDGGFLLNELTAGAFRLRLTHPDHPDLVVEGESSLPGETVSGLRYVLEDGFTIDGFVRDLQPGQSDALVVRAKPEELDFDPIEGFGSPRIATLGAGGAFQLRGLTEGAHVLHVIESKGSAALFAKERSSARRADAGARGVELTVAESYGLTFRVLDAATGEPLTLFDVEAGASWLEALRNDEGDAKTEHPDGRVTMEDVQVDPARPRTQVKITAIGYAPRLIEDIELAAGEVTELGDVRLERVPIVTVRVVDDSTGEPVANARVRLTERPAPMAAGERRISLEMGDSEEAGFAFGGSESTRGETDENGVAELPSLPGKLCRLSVDGRKFAEYTLAEVELPEGGELELEARLKRGGTVVVTVLDASGEPKAGARVRQRPTVGDGGPIVLGGSGARKSKSDGTVTFKNLPAGAHRFSLEEDSPGGMILEGGGQMMIGGASPGSMEQGEEVQVAEGGEAELTLRAAPRGAVVGRVTERGQPLVGATLTFEAASSGEDEEMRRLMPMFGGGTAATTDGQGAFRQEELKVGEYTVRIAHPSRAMDAEFELSVGAGDQREVFELAVAMIEGRVLDSDGKPVVGIEVRPERVRESEGPQRAVAMSFVVQGDTGGAMTFSNAGAAKTTTVTDEDGRYLLRGVASNVELVVKTSSGDFQPGESSPVTVDGNQTRRDVDIAVYAAGSLTVLIRNRDGSAASFCMAELDFVGEAEEAPGPEREFVGESGQTTVRSLRPGTWQVGARTIDMMGSQGGEAPTRRAEPVRIEVLPGETVEVLLELEG